MKKPKSPYRMSKALAAFSVEIIKRTGAPPEILSADGSIIKLGWNGLASLLTVGINQRILSIRLSKRT